MPYVVSPRDRIDRYLDSNGDGSGVKNMVGNYSAGVDFFFQPKRNAILGRILFSLQDEKGMEPEEYGSLGSALTNGWTLWIKNPDDVIAHEFTNGVPIRDNTGIGRLCYDVDLKGWANTTNETIVARFTFGAADAQIFLPGGWKFGVTMNDNIAALTSHYIMLQGRYE